MCVCIKLTFNYWPNTVEWGKKRLTTAISLSNALYSGSPWKGTRFSKWRKEAKPWPGGRGSHRRPWIEAGILSSSDLASLERSQHFCSHSFPQVWVAASGEQRRSQPHKMDSGSGCESRIAWEVTMDHSLGEQLKLTPEFCRGGWGWVGNVVAVRKAMWTELCAVALSFCHLILKFTGCPRVTCCWVGTLEIF